MTDLLINYIVLDAICAIALIILALAALQNVLFSNEMKKYFALAALVTFIVVTAESASIIYENILLAGRAPALIANIIGFSLAPVIAVVLSRAFTVGNGKLRTLLSIPIWINIVLVFSSPWTGLIFSIGSDLNYIRGPLYGWFIFAYLCSYIILIVDSVKAMNYYQCHSKTTFILLLTFTILGTTVQLIWPNAHATWLSVTLSLVLFYAYFCVLTETQDNLTGLLKRNVYDRYTTRIPAGDSGVVVVFDLDGFKQINDLYGHSWGDSCLRIVGNLVKDCFGKLGFCYRTGGDEFCVICRSKDEQRVEAVLSVFHGKIDNIRSDTLQGELPMVSTGYAVFSGSTTEYEHALKKADNQMYNFKFKRRQLRMN